jgi:hypothetical protein
MLLVHLVRARGPAHATLAGALDLSYGATVARMWVVTLFAALALFVAVTVAGKAQSGPVVLGSKISFGPYGKGWGTARPALLDNDGDPSGHAWNIRWIGWGTEAARGSGLGYVLGRAQGTGFREVRLQFRASRLGRCHAGGPVAYTRLQVRIAGLKRGAFGAWWLWNERPNICHP